MTDNESKTPLHVQASDGEERFDVIEILLENGVDKTIKNKNGERAYDIAVSRQDKDNAEILR
ncbi:ankyrin repeat domain-containing protein [Acetivibrio mesophilus]|uniref:ankyrin repeat domain-containing protein n=1 Tax=Acetivibrio mesophilus TaxID=2487273 RepID=UPI0022A6D00E|nr:ankyrin repeat domain-containing protein [Acetivibrio mesophilus]